MNLEEAQEAQRQREVRWVEDGKERFLRHCATAGNNQSGHATAVGAQVMRTCVKRLEERLERYEAETAKEAHGAKDLLLAVLAILSPTHVAAVTIHIAINVCWDFRGAGSGTKTLNGAAIRRATPLGQALRHDLQLRAWTKSADETEKAAIARLKKHIQSDPRSWRRRAAALREKATMPWEDEHCAVLGMDLLALLADACPETFEVKMISRGVRTDRLFRLTDDAREKLTTANDVAAIQHPKIGMMLTPPRAWAYKEKTQCSDHSCSPELALAS